MKSLFGEDYSVIPFKSQMLEIEKKGSRNQLFPVVLRIPGLTRQRKSFNIPDMDKKIIPRHLLPEGYAEFLLDLKRRIKESQLKAAISANRELILLYWDIGKEILNDPDRCFTFLLFLLKYSHETSKINL